MAGRIDKREFAKIMLVLAAAYPHAKITESTIAVYYEVLGDLPLDLLRAVVLQVISEPGQFMPTAGDLRTRAIELIEQARGIPDPEVAWGEVMDKLDIYNPPGPNDFSDPLIYQALTTIGGTRAVGMAAEEMIAATRARFIEAYRALLRRRRFQRYALPQVRDTIAALAAEYRRLPKPKAEEG